MSGPTPEEIRNPPVCAVCARPLSWVENPDGVLGEDLGVGWAHVDTDHVAIPVMEGVLAEPRCDFDDALNPTTIYPIRHPFDVIMIVGNEQLTHRFTTAWLACDGCAGFVERDDLSGLVHRSLRSMMRTGGLSDRDPAVIVRAQRDMLTATHREFLANRLPREPFQAGTR